MNFRRLALGVVCFLGAAAAQAFDGKEHRLVASTGMRLAVGYCTSNPSKCGLDGDSAKELQLADFANPHSRLEYGLLVSSVDYRLNALQLLQRSGSYRSLPESPSDLDPHLINLLTRGGTSFFRAAAANETHFQGDLVAGIRNWHAYAVSVAAGDKSLRLAPNLYGALLVNSISDHFLHDFFAPGHMITPRYGLHDAVALSMHNRYNSTGAQFEVNRDAYAKLLKPLIDHIDKPGAQDFTDFKGAVNDLKDGTIELWGDSQLSQSSEQELFMILLQARSILDVLQSACRGEAVNSFLDVEWRPMTRFFEGDDPQYRFATAKLPFGEYVHYKEHGHEPKAGPVLNFSVGAEMLTGRQTERRGEEKETTARAVYSLDLLVYGGLPLDADQHATDVARAVPVYYKERRQWGLTVGYVFSHSETEVAQGIVARGIVALPMLHSQVSVDVAEKRYEYKGDMPRRTAYGLRVQTGFSLVLFDVGVAREWTFGRRGRLLPETAIRFGATIVAPTSSIPYLRGIERRIYSQGRVRRPRSGAKE